MKLSDDGIKALKLCEGRVVRDGMHVIYDDKTGLPVIGDGSLPHGATIGYGHLIKPNEDFRNGITERMATELLCHDLAIAENTVNNIVTVPLRQNQFDALVMLAFNIGAQNFAKSTVVKYVNNPKFKKSRYPNLESAWRAWNKTNGAVSDGLVRRRNIELNMFISAAV